MPLPDRLKHYRKKRGLSQSALADAADTTTSTIGLIEIGQRKPSWKMLSRLAAALRTTEAKLIE